TNGGAGGGSRADGRASDEPERVQGAGGEDRREARDSASRRDQNGVNATTKARRQWRAHGALDFTEASARRSLPQSSPQRHVRHVCARSGSIQVLRSLRRGGIL